MAAIFTPENFVALVTLTILELVSGWTTSSSSRSSPRTSR